MGKKFSELPGWEVSIRFSKMRPFFMQAPLKLCLCKRVYASKQGDFSKTPTGFFKALNANGRSEISKRDRQDKRIPVVAKVLGIESSELMR